MGLLTLPLSSSALICLAGRHHMSCKDIRQRKSGDRQHYKTNKKNNNSKLTPLWKSIFNLFFYKIPICAEVEFKRQIDPSGPNPGEWFLT